MASAASGSGLIQSSSARQLGPDSASSKGKTRTTAIPTAKPLRRSRIVRPRIDIDDQIFEANRVHDLLSKMSQAAKSLKKSQKKAKQPLIKKAARLNPAALERIAVLKRIFGDSPEDSALACSISTSSQPSSFTGSKGALDMHGTLRDMLKGIPGVEDVVMGLDATIRQGHIPTVAPEEEHPLRRSSVMAPVCSSPSLDARLEDSAVAQICLSSQQDRDILSDHEREVSPDHAE